MGTIKYPSEIAVDGPWLLNSESLEELHDLIESAWGLMLDDFETFKENLIQQKLQEGKKENNENEREIITKDLFRYDLYRLKRESKNFTGQIHGDKKIHSKSLKELIYDQQIQDQKIIGLEIELVKREDKLTIEIDKRYGGNLRIKYSGSSDELQSSIFSLFNKWIKRHAPKPYLRIWSTMLPFQWFVFLALLLFQILMFPSKSDFYKAELKKRAIEQINKGDSLDSKKSIQTLLELQIEHTPDSYQPQEAISNQAYRFKFSIIGLVVCVLLSISPSTIIGIGGNTTKYKLMSWWIKILTVTVPGLILIPIIESKIIDIF